MKKSRRNNKSTDVSKAASDPGTLKRPLSTEIGQPHIVTSSLLVNDIRKDELSPSKRHYTYANMMLDESVMAPVDFTNLQVVSAISGGELRGGKSTRSKNAAKFVNYCIRNMGYGTWMEFANNMSTDLIHGFSASNLVVKKAKHGKYSGTRTLHKISPRRPESIYGWVWNKNNTELMGAIQKPSTTQYKEPKIDSSKISLGMINRTVLQDTDYPFIHRDQMILSNHNPTFNNPQGNSPLNSCFDSYVELALIKHYEIVGVSKDFGGVVVLRIPDTVMEKAADPAKYPEESKFVLELQQDATKLQNGEGTHILLSSNTHEASNQYLYDMEIKGISGAGGTLYNTKDLMMERKKSIYNVFGASFLLLGQNGHGSNALAGSQMTTHDHYVQRAIDWKVDVINNQLVPRLLAVNNVYLDYDEMPRFYPTDPTKVDYETLGKLLQRAGSTELLSDEAVFYIYDQLGFPQDGLADFLEKRRDMNIKSRAGESGGTSGTGNTQAGGASSDTNSENKSLTLVEDTENVTVLYDETNNEEIHLERTK